MLKHTKLCVGLLVISSLTGLVVASDEEVPVQNVVKVLTKLEKVKARPWSTSGITVPEIKAAYKDYLDWSDEEIKVINDKQPLVQALIDFLFKPMQQNPMILPLTSSPEAQKIQDRYIQRLEETYKQMRDSYLGKLVDNYYRRADKVDALIKSLKHNKPVTKRMLQDARDEHDSFRTRLEDIQQHEDIFSNLDEYKNTVNHLNRDEVRVLRESIFPWVNDNLTQDAIERLRKMYQLKLSTANNSKDGMIY